MLLDHGARIDARDEDHNSTPAQWLIGEAPDVARFLLSRGASSDIFMAAAHGCLERIVGLHLAAGCGASLETIRLLLRSGAAAHAHTDNHFGYTPLRAATETGHEDVAALLRELDSPPGAA